MLSQLIAGRYSKLGPDEPYTSRAIRAGWFVRLLMLFTRKR